MVLMRQDECDELAKHQFGSQDLIAHEDVSDTWHDLTNYWDRESCFRTICVEREVRRVDKMAEETEVADLMQGLDDLRLSGVDEGKVEVENAVTIAKAELHDLMAELTIESQGR